MADLSLSTILPGDNRSDITRLMDDIAALSHMASLTYALQERSLCFSRAFEKDEQKGFYRYNFQREWLDQFNFAAADVMDRARSIHYRFQQLQAGEQGIFIPPAP